MKPEVKAMNDLFDALSNLAARSWTTRELSNALERALPTMPRSATELLIGLADENSRSTLRAAHWSSPPLPACCSNSTTKHPSHSRNGASFEIWFRTARTNSISRSSPTRCRSSWITVHCEYAYS